MYASKLLSPLCWALSHEVCASNVITSTDGYVNWTPYCTRCGKQWPARDEQAGDVQVLALKVQKTKQ